jgi:phage tail sheath gpL-like
MADTGQAAQAGELAGQLAVLRNELRAACQAIRRARNLAARWRADGQAVAAAELEDALDDRLCGASQTRFCRCCL